MIHDKNLAFKRFVNKKGFVNNSSKLERFSSVLNKLSSLIETSKQEYFLKIAKKFLKSFLTDEKVTCLYFFYFS